MRQIGLHRVSALAIEIDSDLQLMAAVHPAQPVMDHEVIVLVAVRTSLAKARADGGDTVVREVGSVSRRRWVVAAGAHQRKRRFVHERRRERVRPT